MRDIGPVRLYRPSNEAEALHALASAGESPVIVAGATDLCARFSDGLTATGLISLARVEGYRRIYKDGDDVVIGAGCTHAQGAGDAVLAAFCPDVQVAWRSVASGVERVRAWATIGGNLMALKTRYEISILLTALGARLSFSSNCGRILLDPAELWVSAPPRPYLSQIRIQAKDLIGLRYDRSLRPLATLATSIRRVAGGVRARAVIATQALRPIALDLDAVRSCGSYANAAREHAHSAFSRLPVAFRDGQSSNEYLRHAGSVLLRRHLEGFADV
jgi:aerobic carbon-monoxide dehydrogenase medium subunit